jgi:hypothetical protein
VLVAATWRCLMLALGERVSLTSAYSIVYLAAVGRYLPGRVWALASIAILAAGAGHTVPSAAMASTGTVLLVLLSGLVLGGVGYAASLWHVPFEATSAGWALFVVAPAAVGTAVRQPRARALAFAVAWAAASWLPIALSQWAAARALMFVEPGDTPILLASSVVGWAASLAALPVPAGLGVREAAQAVAVGNLMPTPIAAAFALLVRVTLVAADLVAFAVAWWLRPSPRAAMADAPLHPH